MDKNQVQNGDSVLLHVRGDRSYITRIAMSKPVDIYHHRVQSDLLIGLIYNAFYMLRGGGSNITIDRADDPTVQGYTALTAGGAGDALAGLCDNEAEELRQALLESESYQGKDTEFSRQKAVNRARKRHVLIFSIELANPYSICKYLYTGKTPETNLFMSPGNYSLLLHHSDAARIPGYSRILVYDDLDGRVAAGIASRMVLTDAVVDPTNANVKMLMDECTELINQCSEVKTFRERHRLGFLFLERVRTVLNLPRCDQEVVAVTGRTLGAGLKNALIDSNVLPAKHGLEASRPNIAPFVCAVNSTKLADDDDLGLLGYSIVGDDTSCPKPEDDSVRTDIWTPESITRAIMCDYDMWLERRLCLLKIPVDKLKEVIYSAPDLESFSRNTRAPLCTPLDTDLLPLSFDSLVIAARSRPLPLAQLLSKFIRPAAPVSVYSPSAEALAELGHYLLSTRSGHIQSYTDNRLLDYQILPGRTRPAMLGESFGGYVLTYYTQPPTENDESIFRKSRNVMFSKKRSLKQ
ncbi:Gcd10p family protein [Giardia duodenalis]|uniref:tRNA (adenine(58)-N(1))-methyltransferase non-catalytic subunit TRM6 n=1 Tax=Giardia intestinalis (strain ATCC 50803 / WB clone C6) TaxID=184922 RepID=A0A644FBS5_GIAIC|nr:Gcd10p family protein [Giardia intestinalis]KAE8306059.1 Gcd10p family protein [Giardia intestinalis]